MNIDHPTIGGDRVSFVAHDALISALEAVAASQGVTRSHLARKIIADFLRSEGAMAPQSPASRYDARHRHHTP